MLKNKIFVISVWGLLWSPFIMAYPNFVRLGYTSCVGCHFSPDGGGLLTAYGKGIASTQSLFAYEPSDEEQEALAQKKYIQALQARMMTYKTTSKTRTFPMQADYLARYNVNDNLALETVIAVAPNPSSVPASEAPPTYQRMYARTLGAVYKFNPRHQVAFGVSMLPMGVGIIDHSAWVRDSNRLSVTDIPISLRYNYIDEKINANTFVFYPHPKESTSNREKGVGARGWYAPIKNFAFGAQSLLGESNAIERFQLGLLFKGGIGQYSYLGELNRTWREIKSDKTKFRQWTVFNQFSYLPKDWMMLSYTFEVLDRDNDFTTHQTRHGFILQPRVWKYFTALYEYRLRLYNSQNESEHMLQLCLNWW
jgi:hypothetical protein